MEFADLVEQNGESISRAMEATTLYLSIVTGYLLVAYKAGKDLTRTQLFFITALFVVFSLFFTFGVYEFFMVAHRLQTQFGSELYRGQNEVYGLWIGAAQIAGILGSLHFMYQTRSK